MDDHEVLFRTPSDESVYQGGNKGSVVRPAPVWAGSAIPKDDRNNGGGRKPILGEIIGQGMILPRSIDR